MPTGIFKITFLKRGWMKNSPKTVIEGKETNKILLFYMLIMSRKCFLLIFLSQISSITPMHSQMQLIYEESKNAFFIPFLPQDAPKKQIADVKPEAQARELNYCRHKVEDRIERDGRPLISHLIPTSYITTFRKITK